MYDVEVVITRMSYPLRVTGVSTETRAYEIMESTLAAWGIPIPADLRIPDHFAALLAEQGSYSGTSSDAQISVTRCAP